MNLVFVPMFGHAGLPLSISVGALLNAGILYWGLRRRGLYMPSSGWAVYLLKVFVAALVMATVLWALGRQFDWLAMAATPVLRMASALGVIAVCGVVYFAILAALGLTPRRLVRKPNLSKT